MAGRDKSRRDSVRWPRLELKMRQTEQEGIAVRLRAAIPLANQTVLSARRACLVWFTCRHQ